MNLKIELKHFYATAIAVSIAAVSAVAMAQLQPQVKHLPKVQATAFAGSLQSERQFDRLIIKFKEDATTRAGVFDYNAARTQVTMLEASTAKRLANADVVRLAYLKSVSSQTHVAITGHKLNRAELFVLAKQIEQDPRVAYAEIDEIAQPMLVPNDPHYALLQWHYQGASTHPGGANLPAAWDLAKGVGVVVAVLDTGYRPHADLAANLLPGYDFISENSPGVFTMANDGDGRDSNASDPGDGYAAGVCGTGSPAKNSSWHGTHVAGTIAAVTNNNVGVAGVAFGAKLLPVRVIGVCGGFTSDIVAGMRWAAGLEVPGVPTNPNKAKVLNMSLGGEGDCGSTFRDAVTAVRLTGSVVVAATGNEGNSVIGSPANCTGVIAVTAHTKNGDNATYSSIGPGTTISGPGGGFGTIIRGDGASVYSTSNTGISGPGADNYVGRQGTSMATPHVAGVAALLASLQPAITPDALTSVLTNSARAHPVGTFCASRTDCGAGLLDAKAAIDRLNSLAPIVAASATPAGVRATGSTVGVTAAASAQPGGSNTFNYQWTQLLGTTVSLVNATSASASFVAPVPGGNFTFKVNVTDGNGLVASSEVSVVTNTAPVLNPIAAQTVVQGGNLSFTALATDAENHPVVFLASGLPAGASLNAATGVFTWNGASPVGSYTVTITPNDGAFSGTPQTVSIAVMAPAPASGGGGSMSWVDLLALLLLSGLGVYFGRRPTPRGQSH